MEELKQKLEQMPHLQGIVLSTDANLLFANGKSGVNVEQLTRQARRLGLVIKIDRDPINRSQFDWIIHEKDASRTPEGYPSVFVRLQNGHDFKRLNTNPQFVVVKHKNAIILSEQRKKIEKLFAALAKS